MTDKMDIESQQPKVVVASRSTKRAVIPLIIAGITIITFIICMTLTYNASLSLSISKRKLLSPQKVLIIGDLQNDFFAGGKLSQFVEKKGSPGILINEYIRGKDVTGEKYVEMVNQYISDNLDFDAYVYSVDYHPPGHCSFKYSNKQFIDCTEDEYKYDGLSPHCIQESDGAMLHKSLHIIKTEHNIPVSRNIHQDMYNFINRHRVEPYRYLESISEKPVFWVFKGENPTVDAYSAFADYHNKYQPESRWMHTGLHQALQNKGFIPSETEIYILGISHDGSYLKATAVDAVTLGYSVKFLSSHHIYTKQSQIIFKKGDERLVTIDAENRPAVAGSLKYVTYDTVNRAALNYRVPTWTMGFAPKAENRWPTLSQLRKLIVG